MSELITPGAEEKAKAAEREAMEVLTVAKAVVVTTPEQFQEAGRISAGIRTKIKDLEAQRVAITRPMDDAKKAVMELFRRPKEALEAALAHYDRPMEAYKREELRLRREAEAAAEAERKRLQAEADRKAAEERARLDEIRRQEEEARKAVESAPNPVAAFIQQKKADELAQQGAEAAASTMDAIRESAMVQAPVAYVPKATAAGISVRTNWKFRIVDETKIPREYLIPDEKRIGELARSMKEKAALEGVEFYDEIKIGGR